MSSTRLKAIPAIAITPEASTRRGSVLAQRLLLAELRREQQAEDMAETLRGMGLAR